MCFSIGINEVRVLGVGSVLFPLLEVCPSISDRGVGDRVRSFQEFGNFSIDSLLG